MAVTSVDEQFGSRSSSRNSKGELTLNRSWLIQCNAPTDDPYLVEAGWTSETDLSWGSSYSTESSSLPHAVITSVNVSFLPDSKWIWLLSATYGKRTKEEKNPLQEPPKYRFGLNQTQIPVDYDCFGTPILNAAGDPYEDPVMRDLSRSTLTVRVNVSSFNWATAQAHVDCTNSNIWKGGLSGTVKISDISAEDDWDQEIGQYWRVAYSFHHNQLGWDSQPINKGFNQLVDGKKKKIEIQGKRPDSAQMLDKNGKHIPTGEGQPVINRHQIYNRVPFNFGF